MATGVESYNFPKYRCPVGWLGAFVASANGLDAERVGPLSMYLS